jgi:hypothetical protein
MKVKLYVVMRAETDGVIGDGAIEVPLDDPKYAEIVEHIRSHPGHHAWYHWDERPASLE